MRAFFVGALATQAGLVVHGYWDDHNTFAFQPFNESSTYAVELVRITADGERIPEPDLAWEGYDWNTLVHWRALQNPFQQRHAFSGVGAIEDFLVGALAWIADNTPEDRETLQLEARFIYSRNGGPLEEKILRSPLREVVVQ